MPSPCRSPFVVYRSGEHNYKHASKGRVIRSTAPCGRCDPCVAMRKQEWSGRLIAEALTSAAVAFVTLTYKEEPKEFRYADIQTFLKRFRAKMEYRHGASVRFLCVGERGDRFKRIHWHLLLFFDKPVQIGPWGRETHPGQLWEHWEHGWSTVYDIDPADATGVARYCIKYAIKGHRRHGLPRARMSLKPGIGVPYLVARAREWARAGLTPQGTYVLPGVVWMRGRKEGQHQQFRLSGCCRAEVIEAWRKEWRLTKGDTLPEASPWLLKYDPEAIFRRRATEPFNWRPLQTGRLTVGERGRAVDYTVHSRVIISPQGWAATVAVRDDGKASVFVGTDTVLWSTGFPVKESFSEVLDLPPRETIRLDAWMRSIRPFDYRSRVDEKKETVAEKRKRWREAVRQHVIASIERQRARWGVSPTAHGIYNTAYDPAADNGRTIATSPDEYDPETGEVYASPGYKENRSLNSYGCYGCDE